MEHVVLVRHEADPEDDRVTQWLARHGVASTVVRPFRGETLPGVDGRILGSVVYGGPFNVFEEDCHAFLHAENRWIEGCLKAEVPILGICQGAQSMARVMGAECGPLDPEVHEFGYYEVAPTEAGRTILPEPMLMTQAHFHGFAIPAGATRLAFSRTFPNQAMQAGPRAFAFQFHAEMTPVGFRRWQDAKWAAYGKPGTQDRAEQDRRQALCDAPMELWFNGFLDRLFAPILAARGVQKAS